jgi:RNA polymerase sigma factor (sigma-70 family)
MSDSTQDPEEPTRPEGSPDPASRGFRARFEQMINEFRLIAARRLRKLPAPSLDAEDLVNEAFLKMFREETQRLHQQRSTLGGKPDAILKACFAAACRDVMATRWRRRQRRREVMLPAEIRDLKGGLDHVGDLISELAKHEPQAAEILDFRVFGEMSVQECAEVLGISPSTVDRRYRAAMVWLRSRLDDPNRRRPDAG